MSCNVSVSYDVKDTRTTLAAVDANGFYGVDDYRRFAFADQQIIVLEVLAHLVDRGVRRIPIIPIPTAGRRERRIARG